MMESAASPSTTTSVPPENHRNVTGGAARAAVFGASDGLVTNSSLILGVIGARSGPTFVRFAGIAGLLAGAFSMAVGEYVSMKAQRELAERELAVEAAEIRRHPRAEQKELASIYESRGIDPDTASEVATELMTSDVLALESHAREELGVNPKELGNAPAAAGSSFVSFSLGAAFPLAPWFFTQGTVAVALSLVLAGVAALAIGATLGAFTGRSKLRTALRQLLLSGAAAGVTYAIGRAIGVNVS